MRYSLVDLHEYLADEKVLRQITNKETYPKLIVKMAFKGLDLPIGNYFIRSTTLKRILMMKKKAKINWFKLVMVIPLTLMLFGLVSMKSETGLVFFNQYQTANLHTISKQVTDLKDTLDVGIRVRSLKNPKHYEWIGPLENGKLKVQLGELEYEFSGISTDDEYIKVRELVNILRANSRMSKTYENIQSEYAVEESPEPRDGWEAWESYLREKVSIPEKEQELGLSGMVDIEFVVDQEGRIHHPVIRRSFGGGVDEQLLAIIQRADTPLWKPGKDKNKAVPAVVTSRIAFNFGEGMASRSGFFPEPQKSLDHRTYTSQRLDGDEVFDVVESMPVPPGGMEGWNAYVRENLDYPEAALRNQAEGTVYVMFVVNKKGELLHPEILRGLGHGLDEEAMRLIENSPNWEPGRQHEQAVNVKMRLPIRFRMADHQARATPISVDNDLIAGLIIPSEAFLKYSLQNLQYPKEARIDREAGTVYTKLKFNREGEILDAIIFKGISKEIDKEVLDIFQNAPKWTVKGDKETYQAIYPITFNMGEHQAEAKNAKTTFKGGIIVNAYPASLTKERIKNPVFDVKIIDEKLLSFHGNLMRINEDLEDRIKDLLARSGLDAETATIQLTAEEGVRMGTVQDVQAALRVNGLNRLLYTSRSSEETGKYGTDPQINLNRGPDQPLVILDGKEKTDMNGIDPIDIESITVLKGKKATNLYGGKAKNGVILIVSHDN